MANKSSSFDFENEDFLFENIWGQRLEGFAIEEPNVFRDITESDIAYIKKRAPFLQLMNPQAQFGDSVTLHFVPAKSGWTIFDYGDALSASPGNQLFNAYPPLAINLTPKATAEAESESESESENNSRKDQRLTEEEESGTGETEYAPTGQGTLIKQAFDTAEAMVLLVGKRWPSIKVIGGDRLMQWAAWVIAEEQGVQLEGFEPTRQEKEKRQRLLRKRRQAAEATAQPRPKTP
jgi:hypothetical protein